MQAMNSRLQSQAPYESIAGRLGPAPLTGPGQARPTIFFCNRFFYPDESATSQLMSDLAFALAADRIDVQVITGRTGYDLPSRRSAASEVVNGVRVHRVPSTNLGRLSKFKRLLDYATFYFHCAWQLVRRVRPGDCIVASTDPPMVSVVCMIVARLKGARLVNWLHDIFPEVAQNLRVPLLRGPISAALLGIRDASLRHAERNVVIGNLMYKHLERRGITGDRLAIIANWCDGRVVYPVPHVRNPLRAQWALENKFVVGYSGNLGSAHEYATLLDAMSRLRDDPRIVFLFIGGGSGRGKLEAEAHARGLRNVLFKPYQPRSKLCYSLGAADVHLVSLLPSLEGLIVPSKMYGVLAAGRPVVFVGSADGELAPMIKAHELGVQVNAGDGAALSQALIALAADPQGCARMGQNGRELFEQHFDINVCVDSWRALLAPATVTAHVS